MYREKYQRILQVKKHPIKYYVGSELDIIRTCNDPIHALGKLAISDSIRIGLSVSLTCSTMIDPSISFVNSTLEKPGYQ